MNAILSLSTLALYVSYLIPIILLVMKRLRKEPIAFGPFKLGQYIPLAAAASIIELTIEAGRAGLWINIYAIVFAIYIVIFLPFPVATPVSAQSMNYAGPVFIGTNPLHMRAYSRYKMF